MNFQMFKLDLDKAEEPEIKLPTSFGSSKKQESSRKTSTFALLTTPKPLTLWIIKTVENSSRNGNTRLPDLSPEKTLCRSGNKLELDMEQQTGSKFEKEYVKTVYCHCAYLTYMQSTSWETLGWKKHKLESRLPGEISITSDMQMTTPPYGRKRRRTKEPLDESERGEWKSWLKTAFKKLRSWHPVPLVHGK